MLDLATWRHAARGRIFESAGSDVVGTAQGRTTRVKGELLPRCLCGREANPSMKTDPTVQSCLDGGCGARERRAAPALCLWERKQIP